MSESLMRAMKITAVGWFVAMGVLNLHADVKLPHLISDGMVLQRGMKIAIWGRADAGENVTVSLNGGQAAATADGEGRWKVNLGPLTAGGPYTMTVSGKNTITLHDVLVGEVWICSGQSNMAMPVGMTEVAGSQRGVLNYQDEIAHADYPKLRLFTVENAVARTPQTDVHGYWTPTTPQSIVEFSAVGYFFGRELLKNLNVPIGLIHSSWGGTMAEAWTSHGALAADPEFRSILESGEKLLGTYPSVFQQFEQDYQNWKTASSAAQAEGNPLPLPPTMPYDPRQSADLPSGLFNAMLAPLTSYAIKGVIWYQGESNAGRPAQYRKLFPTMIRDWRRAWGQGDFPFLFVQLANYDPQPDLKESRLEWPELREAQLMTLSLPKTGMAVTIDIGSGDDIHPKNKQDVGYRLALAAQAIGYGQDVMYSGPIYDSMSVEDDKIRLHFKYAYNGLMPRRPPIYGGALHLWGFEVAGSDHRFVAASATIEGDTVVVGSPKVAHPVAARYGWANNPVCNLYNRAGLPASPFRTAEWPQGNDE